MYKCKGEVKMEIVKKKIEEIFPYENNPRKNDEAVKYVANSIKEFGFRVPIVIDKNGVIVAGHTRYKASKELGLKEIPCVVADDLNEEQITAYRLADNKVGEIAEWDFDMLAEELADIDIDMSEFGFDFEEEKEEKKERKDVDLNEEYSIIIKFENDVELEEAYNKFVEEGYNCQISTL